MRIRASAVPSLAGLLLILSVASLAFSCSHEPSASPTPTPSGTSLPVNQDDPVQVYVMNVGGQPTLLTTLSNVPTWAWSSDDDHTALLTDVRGYSGNKVHVISAQAGAEIFAADTTGYPVKAVWSPNREWLAWESSTQDAVTVEVMRADGSERRQLESGVSGPEYGELFAWEDDNTLLASLWEGTESDETGLPTDQQLFEFDVTNNSERQFRQPNDAAVAEVSPDASRVAFVVGGGQQGCPYGEFPWSLWIMDVSDGSLHQALPDTCQLNSASWSPDSSQIAFAVGTTDDSGGTYILDLATGSSRKLSSSSKLADHVQRWSPDGSAVEVYRTGCSEQGVCPEPLPQLVVISVADGSENAIFSDAVYALSPNGGALAFDKDGLQVAQFPSGTPREVMAADSDWSFSLLGWSPDGQWFAFARSRVSVPAASPSP